MTDLGPLDFSRIAALTVSGFDPSKTALDAVVEHIEVLCLDLIDRHKARLDAILAGRDIGELPPDEQRAARSAWADLKNFEQMQTAIPRALGIYAGLLFRSNPTRDEAETAIFLLAKLADDLIQVGANYMIGRTADESPPPITSSEFASNGGKKRAEKDAIAKKPVKERFAQICASLMLEDPQRLSSQLIKAAKKVWGDATPVLPESKQLSTWLEEAVSAGTVPPPRTDRRSKKVRKSAG